MTKEEIIEFCEMKAELEPENEDIYAAIIKALEQEPILGKIRAKIEKLQKMCDTNDLNLLSQHSAFGMALDVIDEYKAESEEKE